MATIVGELISKKPVELKPIPDQPGYYYVPQRTEFIVKSKYLVCYKPSSCLLGIIAIQIIHLTYFSSYLSEDSLPYEQQSLVGGLFSKMSLTLSSKGDTSMVDGRHIEYYVIPNNTEFVLRTKHHGKCIMSTKVTNCIHDMSVFLYRECWK